jgi:flagellar hook protein FlgE
MISALNNALSAINAFDKKMSVISNNVANVETDGFKKSRADLKEGDAGGVAVDISAVNTPGPAVTVEGNGGITEQELSNVDLTEEIPRTMITGIGYEANLKMMKTADEMIGTLLNTFG